MSGFFFTVLILAFFLNAKATTAEQSKSAPGISNSINAQTDSFKPDQFPYSSECPLLQRLTIPELIEPKKIVVSPEHVRKAQNALKVRGYNAGEPNGRLNPPTQNALSRFQQDKNLPATGLLDEVTASELGVEIHE